MANYGSNFVNLKFDNATKSYTGVIKKEDCPLFDGDQVFVFIKERELQSGKKIKGTLVIAPDGGTDKYGEPTGKFTAPLWENVNETTNKVSWGCTFEKGLCWLTMYQGQSKTDMPNYSLRVSWDIDTYNEQDVSNDESFGKENSKQESLLDVIPSVQKEEVKIAHDHSDLPF